jgi:hypothetical protein
VVLGQLARESLVVDQADGLEPDQLLVDRTGLEPRPQEADLQLASRPRPDGKESQGAFVETQGVLGDGSASHVRAGDERAFP